MSSDFGVLPGFELRRLTGGSFEHSLREASEALQQVRKDATVVATFPDYLIFEDDGFFRAALSRSDSGKLTITGTSEIEVQVIDESRADRYVEEEVRAIVDLWMSGAVATAKDRLSEVAPKIRKSLVRDEGALIDSVAGVLEDSRPWKRALSDRHAQIETFLGSDLQEILEDQLRPKFRQLYDGSIQEEKLPEYASLVAQDLDVVVARIDSLSETTSEAFEAIFDALVEAQTSESDDTGVLDLYEGFALDLIEDLDRLQRQVGVVRDRVTSVSSQGKLRDTLVEGIGPYEVASRFVVKVANRMKKA